jgi:hypothetical protein
MAVSAVGLAEQSSGAGGALAEAAAARAGGDGRLARR